jgi:hypothetical protein
MNRRNFLSRSAGIGSIAIFQGARPVDPIVQGVGIDPNEVGEQRASLSILRERDVSLSTEQILALRSTPVQIIPAPAAGKIIVPIWAIARYTAGPDPFVVDAINDYITIAPAANPESNYEFYCYVDGLLNRTEDAVNLFASNAGYPGVPSPEVAGQSFVVGVDIPKGAPWTGGGGSLKVKAGYIIV